MRYGVPFAAAILLMAAKYPARLAQKLNINGVNNDRGCQRERTDQRHVGFSEVPESEKNEVEPAARK